MKNLDLSKKCIPCEVGGLPLEAKEASDFLLQTPKWNISNDYKKISREFVFKNFNQALDFSNKVGAIAESEGHHPDIHIHYNKVLLELWTHAVGGLTENDFLVAGKINQLSS